MKNSTLLALLFCYSMYSHAQFGTTPTAPIVNPITWMGTVSNEWSNPLNWWPAQVPGPSNSVLFKAATENRFCTVDIPVDVYSIHMETRVGARYEIAQGAPVVIRNGANMNTCFWIYDMNTFPATGYPFRVESGPFVGNTCYLWPEANTYFGGDVYLINNSAFDMKDSVVYKGNVFLGNTEYLDPIRGGNSTTVFSGNQNQRIKGTTYWGTNITVDKPNNSALILDTSYINTTSPFLLYAAANVHLKNGRIIGERNMYQDGTSLIVDETFDGLETKFETVAGWVELNHPLLTSFKSEFIAYGSQFVTKKPSLLFGTGNGTLQLFGNAFNDSENKEIEFNTREVFYTGNNPMMGKTIVLKGNFTGNHPTVMQPDSRFIVRGNGYSKISSTMPIQFNELVVEKDPGATVSIQSASIQAVKFTGKSGTLTGPGALWVTDSAVTHPGAIMQAPLVFKGSNQVAKFDGGWLGNISIDQPVRGVVNLAGNFTLGQQQPQSLQLIQGILRVPYPYLLQFGANATVLGGSAQSFVSGPMRKTGNTAFTFPAGNWLNATAPTYYAPVRISGTDYYSNLSGNATYQVNYYRGNPQLQFSNQTDAPLTGISAAEYWQILRIAGNSGHIWLSYEYTRSQLPLLGAVRQAGYRMPSSSWKQEGNRLITASGLSYVGANQAQGTPVYFTVGTANAMMMNTLGAKADLELTGNTMDVFPNPATAGSMVTLENKSWRNKMVQLRILSPDGAAVQQQQQQFDMNGRARINLGSLPKGTYFVQGTVSGKQATKLIIVQ